MKSKIGYPAGFMFLWLTCSRVGLADSALRPASADQQAILKALTISACPRWLQERFDGIADVPAAFEGELKIPAEWQLPSGVAEELRHAPPPGIRWANQSACPNYHVIDGEKAAALIAADSHIPKDWGVLQAEYPGLMGMAELTLPAITPDGNRAIAVMSWRSAYYSSSAVLFEVVRAQEGWKVSRRQTLWVHAN